MMPLWYRIHSASSGTRYALDTTEYPWCPRSQGTERLSRQMQGAIQTSAAHSIRRCSTKVLIQKGGDSDKLRCQEMYAHPNTNISTGLKLEEPATSHGIALLGSIIC